MTKKNTLLLGMLLLFLVLPVTIFAQSDIETLLIETAGTDGAGYDTSIEPETGVATLAGKIVRAFLSLTGIIFVVYTIYGGFLWLTSGGNEERITKAKSILRNGIIGLIVIFSAAAIYVLVYSTISN